MTTSPFTPLANRHRQGATSDDNARMRSGRSLDEDQRAFAGAILDPARPVPEGLAGPDGLPSERRFAVYRNNVVAGLSGTLKAAFPVVHRLVGDAFFMAMARIHVAQEPPRTPVMLEYGEAFPAFIAAFEPAAGLPYLADVARLERAWAESYHAAEAAPVDPAIFGAMAAADIAALRFGLHPSLRIVRSPFPILAIWQANIGAGEPRPIDLSAGGDDVLILRPAAEVEIRLLPPGGADFLERLDAGAAFVDAAAETLALTPRFDLAGAIAGIVGSGAITRCDSPDKESRSPAPASWP